MRLRTFFPPTFQEFVRSKKAGKRLTHSLVLPCFVVGLLWSSFIVSASAESALTIIDATFTDGISNRQPQNRLTLFPINGHRDNTRLWFWFQVHCDGLCHNERNPHPKIPIMVKWALKEENMFVVKSTVPLTVENTKWRTWTSKRYLKPGTWQVVIFSKQGPVCLKDQCEFQVQVID